LADAFRPEIGILDIGLPVMDGYELAERPRGRNGMRLVAVTGYGQEQDRRRAEKAGFSRHFVKPADAEQLLAAIDSLDVDDDASSAPEARHIRPS